MGTLIHNGVVYADVNQGLAPLFNTVKLISGKINVSTGEIIDDSDFYYTDFIPLSNGDITFDLGYSSSQTYAGLVIYDDNKDYVNYWNANSRYRNVDNSSLYTQGARWFRLSFPISKMHYVFAHDWIANKIYCADEPYWTTNMLSAYEDSTLFDNYFNRNTTTPVITHSSLREVSLSFQDQSDSGYEGASFSTPLSAGLYIAEIYATVDTNTGLANDAPWGIYSTSNSTDAQNFQDGVTLDTSDYNTYVPFNTSDTDEHYYEVPIKLLTSGTAYLCFATGADNGTNATITVRSIKIRKASTKVVDEGSAILIAKSITANGTYTAIDDSADGYSSVQVNVPGSTSILITKTISVDGTYYAAADNADGYSCVVVNTIHSTPTPEVDPVFGNLIHYIDFTVYSGYNNLFYDQFGPFGYATMSSGCTFTPGTGVQGFVSSSAYISLPSFYNLQINDTFVLDFGSVSWGQGSNHGRLLMYSGASGLIYRSGAYWNFYGNSEWGNNITISQNYLDNAKLGAKIIASNQIELYKDGVLFGTVTQGDINKLLTTPLTIGSSSGNGFGVAVLKSLKIYRAIT